MVVGWVVMECGGKLEVDCLDIQIGRWVPWRWILAWRAWTTELISFQWSRWMRRVNCVAERNDVTIQDEKGLLKKLSCLPQPLGFV
jgi:hypothetical protein